MEQTPRGIPAPIGSEPDAVPEYLAKLVSFLDPGPLSAYDPAKAALGQRIVFLVIGDDDPLESNAAPILGTVYLDRSRARLWIPFTQLVNGVDTLSWFRIGEDTDAAIADIAAGQLGMVRTATASGAILKAGTATLGLTGIDAGANTNVWRASVPFPEPFSVNTIPVVNVDNVSADTQPNVVLGLLNVTATGFQVLITRSDVPFQLNDQVTVNWTAVGR
jgi:hypothetical protein